MLFRSKRRPGQIRQITEVLAGYGVPARKLEVLEDLEGGRIEVRAVARFERDIDVREFFDKVQALEGIQRIQIE